MNTKNSWMLEAGLSLIDFLVILLAAAWVLGFRVNFTSSMPTGLYLLSFGPVHRSDLVSFCLPPDNPYVPLAGERTYLQTGLCLSGRQPLLKRLVGLPGDDLLVTGEGLVLNGLPLAGSKRPERDSRGRALPDSLLMAGVIPEGQALLLSLEHAGSFDGRHFGLIPMGSLQKVRPVVVMGQE